jgi:uncharacterized NTF2-like protein DUF6841
MTKQTTLNNFLLDYCAAFRPGNIAAVAEFYHSPVTMIFGDRVSVLKNEDEIINTLQAVMDGLVNQGFCRSEVDSCHVHEFAENTALLSATFSRLKEDDTVLEKLGATYTVVNKGSGYKIASLVAHGTASVISNQ